MEKVVVTGDSKQIDLLIRESKVKIARGQLSFKKVGPKETPKAKAPKAETSKAPETAEIQ
jgi:hypothetical protein